LNFVPEGVKISELMHRQILAVSVMATFPLVHAQISPLDQEAHRPLQKMITPDSTTPSGYTPAQIRHAYGFDQIANLGDGQVIGIVDAYDVPAVESDLAVFTSTFGLPPCTKASGCLTVVYAAGVQPGQNKGWSDETSLDVQWAHAIAPNAKIVLVEAATGTMANLLAAVPVAVKNGARIVTMSWGSSGEFSTETTLDARVFTNSAVTYLAASGDSGHNHFGYPAASPRVVSAGGTTLNLDATGDILSETAWSGSSGGISKYYPEPSYQSGVQSTGFRGIPDVAYDSNPNTGVPVYDSEDGDWFQVGGTSAASPQWAALTAIANSLRASHSKATIGSNFLNVIYSSELDFFDITKGINGLCGALCSAQVGYDYVTGLGSPMAPTVVAALSSAP
jgi:subtilase family serine protease